PLLLSDLDVFKELAGEHAAYFETGSSSALNHQVRKAIETIGPSSRSIETPTWNDFTTRVFEFMAGDHTHHTF
ncbi:MAG: glycosyltransferase family 4 protein, partial [Phyllobacteriaceae bacterium]|nr:glycosyltransferase family 4 protein [Phyllobacteriaceae bacterium]